MLEKLSYRYKKGELETVRSEAIFGAWDQGLVDPGSIPIFETDDARIIKNKGERIVAIAFSLIPHLLVFHEPRAFKSRGGEKTTPDFFVINLLSQRSRGVYIEVTQAGSFEDFRNKDKQLRVMREVLASKNGLSYRQYNGPVLSALEVSLSNRGLLSEVDFLGGYDDEIQVRSA